ncbi:MAG: DUF177 domain-containing protein [Deltaproteobacteria bacterium]|nr:DUF177 domain-containing protein [Deltaproteobacteria bacterium]
MRIAVDDIKAAPTELQFVEEVSELNRTLAGRSEAEYHLPVSLRVSLAHFRSGEDLILSGTIQGEFVGTCSRCVEEYTSPIQRAFSVTLSPQFQTTHREVELSVDELSAGFYSEAHIDLSALVGEETLLALPSQPLCRENCRGLCGQCGTNLNVESCACRPLWRDPRLAVLSTLRLPSQR